MSKIKRIVFVWNADFSLSGGINALKEVVSGKHSCTLCEIAYDRATQTKEWKDYKSELAQKLGAEIRQPCRNQLKKSELAVAGSDFPTVLAYTDSGIVKLLGGADIADCGADFQSLRARLNAAIKQVELSSS